MKSLRRLILEILVFMILLIRAGSAGEPTQIPWPIGYSEDEMHYSRDLWRTYGNINGLWDVVSGHNAGNFHPGIDIAINTEVDGCDEVRCVKAGYVTYRTEYSLPGSEVDDYIVVICDEPPSSATRGWCYQHLLSL